MLTSTRRSSGGCGGSEPACAGKGSTLRTTARRCGRRRRTSSCPCCSSSAGSRSAPMRVARVIRIWRASAIAGSITPLAVIAPCLAATFAKRSRSSTQRTISRNMRSSCCSSSYRSSTAAHSASPARRVPFGGTGRCALTLAMNLQSMPTCAPTGAGRKNLPSGPFLLGARFPPTAVPDRVRDRIPPSQSDSAAVINTTQWES